eukprot:5394981-Pleurochrysis_carterae.AAC.5
MRGGMTLVAQARRFVCIESPTLARRALRNRADITHTQIASRRATNTQTSRHPPRRHPKYGQQIDPTDGRQRWRLHGGGGCAHRREAQVRARVALLHARNPAARACIARLCACIARLLLRAPASTTRPWRRRRPGSAPTQRRAPSPCEACWAATAQSPTSGARPNTWKRTQLRSSVETQGNEADKQAHTRARQAKSANKAHSSDALMRTRLWRGRLKAHADAQARMQREDVGIHTNSNKREITR